MNIVEEVKLGAVPMPAKVSLIWLLFYLYRP